MAACTLRRSGSLTGTDPVITWETVPTETPAISATFLMLGMVSTPFHTHGIVLRATAPQPGEAGTKQEAAYLTRRREDAEENAQKLSLIHISEPTRLGM